MSLSPALLWTVLSLTLSGVGALMFLWAIFWDRARGRLRCAGCWYDMKGAVEARDEPPWTCPECGKKTTKLRRLKRTRRRRRIAIAAAIVVVLATYAMLARDRILERGWVGAIPTTVLVFIAPINAQSWDWYTSKYFDGIERSYVSGFGSGSHSLLRECVQRLEQRDVWLVHWRVYIDRIVESCPEIKETICESRDAWPREAPVHVRGRLSMGMFGMRDEDLRIGARRRGERGKAPIMPDEYPNDRYDGSLGIARAPIEVEVEIQIATRQRWITDEGVPPYPFGPDPSSYRTAWRGVVRTTTIDDRSAAEIMRPVDDPSDGKEIARDLRPVFVVRRDGTVHLGVGFVNFHVGGPNDCAVGLRLEVLKNDKPVATGEYFIFNYPPTQGVGFIQYMNLWNEVPLRWHGMPPNSQVDLASDVWTLRATGDPVVSMRDFNRDRYWTGVIEMPLRRLERSEDEEWDDE